MAPVLLINAEHPHAGRLDALRRTPAADAALEALQRRLAEAERRLAEQADALHTLRQSELRLLEAQRVAKIGSWEFDVATSRLTWSAEMFRLLGFDPAPGEPTYDGLMTHYHPDDVPLHDAKVIQALNDGLPYELDIRILSGEGLMRWGHTKGQAARDDSGRITRLFGTVMDITERKQAEEENARLAAIIESSNDAVLGVTLDGTLVSWNASAERLYGYKESEIIGQHVSVLAPPEQRGFLASVIRDLQRGDGRADLEMQSRRQDGSMVNTVLTVSPIRDSADTMIGIAAISRDVTAQRLAEEAVRRSEARLAEAQRIAHIGSWEVDISTGTVTFSREMFHLFDLDPEADVPTIEFLLSKYHSDDVESHKALVSQAYADGKPFVTDIRVIRSGGDIRWCHIVGQPVRDSGGAVVRLIGTTMDITDRMLVEERFRVLFECSSEAHFLVNSSGVIDCNQAALRMMACPDKAALVSIHPAALSPERQPDGELSSVKGLAMEAAARKNGIHRFEWMHKKWSGEEFPTEIVLTPVTLSGKPAMLAVWHDLTERKLAEQRIRDYSVILEFQKQELEQANRELCNLATTDGLTGLKNHRAFQERLQEECEAAQRHAAPLSLVLLDVDHFKQFNDTFGHPAGDAVLKQVAHLLERTMRDCDFVARYGGEEFVLVLPQTDPAGALRAAERCRLAVEQDEWRCRPVTASFGVATLSPDCAGGDALIAAADQALYAAKFNGRNQALHAHTVCPLPDQITAGPISLVS